MAKDNASSESAARKALIHGDRKLLRELVRETVRQVLEAEMTACVGAGPGDRSEKQRGYRAGCCARTSITRAGKLELRVPRDPEERFSTELFEVVPGNGRVSASPEPADPGRPDPCHLGRSSRPANAGANPNAPVG